MKNFTLAVCTVACMLGFTLSANAQWQETSGPNGASVYSLAVSGSTLFAGTYGGGVYTSVDNGTTWIAKNNGITYLYINALTVIGTSIFAGTDGGGVFVSTNGGATWSARNIGLTSLYVASIAATGSHIFAATKSGGIFTSTNAGNAWAPADSGLTATYFLSIATTLGKYVIAGSNGSGIFLSKDTGKTWTNTGPSTEIYALAANGANLYAGTYQGISLSKDTGNTWVTADSGMAVRDTAKPVYALAASGTNMLAGLYGGGIFITTNNGGYWNAFSTGGLANVVIHSLAVNSSYIFAGTNSGQVWKRPLSDITTCVPAITASDTTTFCQGGSVTLTATAGSSYLWSDGETTQSIVVNTSASYSCVINTNCGYLTSNVIAVTVNPLPVATITPSGETSFCKGGNVTLTASNGNSYLWSNNSTTSSITVSTSQAVTVTITGSNGCRASASITIKEIFPSIITQPKSDSAVATCMARFIVGDTTSNVTYQWQDSLSLGFYNLSESGLYIGVNSDTLTIAEVNLAMNGYSFRCIISNGGCTDTSKIAVLTVHPVATSVRTDTLCSGDSLGVGAHIYHASGNYIDTLRNGAGCDSIIITNNLTIDSVIKHSQTLTLCAGDSFTVGMHTYTMSGTYTDTIPAGTGCDSIVFTKLNIDSIIKYTQTISLCAGDSIIVGIHTYYKSSTYIDSIKNGRGCDSIVTTKLTIKSAITSSQSDTLCLGDSLIIGNGMTTGIYIHHLTGTYTDTLRTAKGCDSVVTSHLSFRAAITATQTDTLCAGDTLTVGLHAYATSGTYMDTLTSLVHGCDSMLTTHLVIDSTIRHTQTDMLCFGDTLTVGMHIYTASGTYIDTIPKGSGCDSIVTTNLTVNPFINTIITPRGDSLSAHAAAGAGYKWFNCAHRTIILATTRDFMPTADSEYAVIVTINGCADTSSCYTVTNVGISSLSLNYFITVYPNPATNQLTIHTSSPLKDKTVTISVMNVIGEIMQEEKLNWSSDININIGNLPSGMYFLQMKSESGSVVKRFVKE